MHTNLTTPVEFLITAKTLGVPKEIATLFFHRKIGKRGYDDIGVQLLNTGMFTTEAQVSKVLTSLWKTFRNRELYGIGGSPEPKPQEPVSYGTYLQLARSGLESLIGKFEFPGYDATKRSVADRVVVFSDCHIPFMNEATAAQILADPAEECWMLGDLLDILAVTHFRQSMGTEHISVREELAQGRAFLEQLARKFKRVKILKNSNHPDRIIKSVQSKVPAILPLIVNPMDLLAMGLSNVEVVTTLIPDTSPTVKFGQDIEVGWLSKQGDVLCSHAENFCTAEGVKQLNMWMQQWGSLMGVDSYRVLLHAHTHTLGTSFTPDGRLLVNTGSCCKVMPYMLENFGKFNPPVNGYVILNQHKGVTDLNSVRVVYTG